MDTASRNEQLECPAGDPVPQLGRHVGSPRRTSCVVARRVLGGTLRHHVPLAIYVAASDWTRARPPSASLVALSLLSLSTRRYVRLAPLHMSSLEPPSLCNARPRRLRRWRLWAGPFCPRSGGFRRRSRRAALRRPYRPATERVHGVVQFFLSFSSPPGHARVSHALRRKRSRLLHPLT